MKITIFGAVTISAFQPGGDMVHIIWTEPPTTVPNIILLDIVSLLQTGRYIFHLLRAAETSFNAVNTGKLVFKNHL